MTTIVNRTDDVFYPNNFKIKDVSPASIDDLLYENP